MVVISNCNFTPPRPFLFILANCNCFGIGTRAIEGRSGEITGPLHADLSPSCSPCEKHAVLLVRTRSSEGRYDKEHQRLTDNVTIRTLLQFENPRLLRAGFGPRSTRRYRTRPESWIHISSMVLLTLNFVPPFLNFLSPSTCFAPILCGIGHAQAFYELSSREVHGECFRSMPCMTQILMQCTGN